MKFLVLFLCLAVVQSVPLVYDEAKSQSVIGGLVNCADSELSLCFKEQLLKVADRVGNVRKLKIIDGITLLNNGAKEARSNDVFSTDPEERNKQVTERLWRSAADLLQTTDLELSVPGSDETESRALEEEGRKKKKGLKKKLKMLIPLALVAKAKAIAIGVLALVVIAVSVFKIAAIAKIAAAFKAIALIKALLMKKNNTEEQSWAPYEEHGPSHGWESSGWSRTKPEASNLAYSAHSK